MKPLRVLSLITLVLALMQAGAQEASKEMRTLRLRLQEAQLALDNYSSELKKAETTFHEAQELFAKGLYSKTELSAAESRYQEAKLAAEQATIDLEKTRLAFLSDALNVTLERASLYLDNQGQKHAVLSIRNTSNVRRIIDDQGKYSQEEKLGLLTIDNLAVRILFEGKLVGRPFERKLTQLPYNRTMEADFTLQRETESVTVEIAFGDTVMQLPVYLEREAKDDRVLIEALQFSLEGELGSRVNFEMTLERFVDDDKTFTLEVLNLPAAYSYEFQEVGSETRTSVSRIRFAKGTTTKTIRFIINMPREIPKDELNQKIAFFVMVLDRFAQQRLGTVKATKQGGQLGAEDLDSARVSFEALELIPRGRAEVTITASNLFIKARMGEPIKYNFELYNSGTVLLDRIRIYATLPVGWSAALVPEKDITLDVESKKKIDMEIIPAVDVVAGDYEIKLDAKTMHQGREVEAVDKVLRIQLEGKSNFLIGAILLILLIGMIVGVAVMTIRISRR